MAVDLDDRRLRVAAALRSAMRANTAARAKLLGVKGEALAAATAADRAVATSPTMRAIERYTGVLYGALDVASLSAAPRRRLDDSVLVVSGLWGLVAPGDPIPDYKLKMGSSLGALGKLSTWWRPGIDAALQARLDARPGPVWNLLPNEHDAAWSGLAERAGRTARPVYTVRFLEPASDGRLVAVAHWNKFLKGALVRFLVEHPGAEEDELAAWEHPSGYRLDPDRTVTDDRGRRVLSFVAGR
jgi:cytoplasmic iron level regulating protein YaaA (DUF328/UPF0246 family)